MKLTNEEQALMGRTVRCARQIQYPGVIGTIQRGLTGEIYDFGQSSNDPFIKWSDNRTTSTPWDYIELT